MAILQDTEKPVGYIDMDAPPVTEGEETWKSVYGLSLREIKEIEFAKMYVEKFEHGTDGHSRLMLIDHMNSVLESLFETNTQLLAENEAFRDIMAQLPTDFDIPTESEAETKE